MKTSVEKIRAIASKISNLPTLPTIISSLIELIDNPRSDARVLAKLISKDQSLTARVLKMANSAYYGCSGKISTVNRAIVVLGMNTVKEIGLSLSIYDAFKSVGLVRDFDVSHYWEHSVAVGTAARILGRGRSQIEGGELYVAGLLHDIGKMIFIQYLAEEFSEVNSYMKQEKISYYMAEQEILGVTHAEVGALIAKRWNLPDHIVSCIRFHHTPKLNDPYLKESLIINAADYIAHRLSLGNRDHRRVDSLEEHLVYLFEEHLNLSQDEFWKIEDELLLSIDSNDFIHIASDD